MGIVLIIIGSLALLAATASLVLVLTEKKRNQERSAAMMRLVSHFAEGYDSRIKALEDGTVPDYEKAKEAAKAVNDFNSGISGILGFDPYVAIRKQREDNGGDTR